jgi:prepilin-type processing-associated H-X9-DG protein
MRGVVKIGVGLLLVLLVGGLVVAAVGKVRHAAALSACRNNLRMVGLGLAAHHEDWGRFPPGALPNPGLPPEKRIGWLTQVWPQCMEGGYHTRFDATKAWDDEANCPPCCFRREARYKKEVVGKLRFLLCPANPTQFDPSLPCPTHYLGIAGVGEDAAMLPLSDRRAGFFGYDRKVRERDITDGLATTLAVAEALDGGPWTAGGRATVRGLSGGEAPYLGEGGQFASRHRVGFFPWSGPVVTNVLFADGSVRTLTPSVSPQVLEALATIAGGEEVGPFGE